MHAVEDEGRKEGATDITSEQTKQKQERKVHRKQPSHKREERKKSNRGKQAREDRHPRKSHVQESERGGANEAIERERERRLEKIRAKAV